MYEINDIIQIQVSAGLKNTAGLNYLNLIINTIRIKTNKIKII